MVKRYRELMIRPVEKKKEGMFNFECEALQWQGYSCLQFDSTVLKKHSQFFLFTSRHAPRSAIRGSLELFLRTGS